MASLKKFAHGAVLNQLRHNERTLENSSNEDINPERSGDNYALFTPEEGSCFDRYLERKEELYCYNRADVKTMAAWIVTAPEELPIDQQQRFLQSVYNLLEDRYHKENVVQAIVHQDEGGQPHLHFCFIPAAPDLKHEDFSEKICANDVLNLNEFKHFHPDLQHYLTAEGFDCCVHSGITREIGGNLTVDELKHREEYLHKKGYDRGVQW